MVPFKSSICSVVWGRLSVERRSQGEAKGQRGALSLGALGLHFLALLQPLRTSSETLSVSQGAVKANMVLRSFHTLSSLIHVSDKLVPFTFAMY